MENTDLLSLDLSGTQAISVPLETVEVIVTAKTMVDDYAKAFVMEATRVNPERAKQVNLSEEEMKLYCKYLLINRVNFCAGMPVDMRQFKVMWMPSFIQLALRMVGIVVKRDIGLKFVPTTSDSCTMTKEQALQVSEKVAMFERDLQVVYDAMPRSVEGDPDVMSTALIAGYVRSIARVTHVVSTYVSAFLGMKLKEEQIFKVLYRVQYDDLSFISSSLMRAKGVLR